jgi:hypothetical protein
VKLRTSRSSERGRVERRWCEWAGDCSRTGNRVYLITSRGRDEANDFRLGPAGNLEQRCSIRRESCLSRV